MESGMKILTFIFVVATVYLAHVEGWHINICNPETGLMQSTCTRRSIRWYIVPYTCWHGRATCYNWRLGYQISNYSCLKRCAVNGGWTEWGEMYQVSACSKSCGGGVEEHNQDRSCTRPTPKNGGKPCVGEEVKKTFKECNTFRCPADICREIVRGYRAYPDPTETKLFLQCDHKEAYTMKCDEKLVWKQDIMSCDWPEKECTDGAKHPHSSDPTKYMQCIHGISRVMPCGSGTVWDQETKACVHEEEEEEDGEDCTVGEMRPSKEKTMYLECFHGKLIERPCAPGTEWRQEGSSGKCKPQS